MFFNYLVDPASSHMLVLKIKPCMSKYRWIRNRNCGWLNKSVIINLVMIFFYLDNPVNCRANTWIRKQNTSIFCLPLSMLKKKKNSLFFVFSNRVPDCLGSKKWIKTDLLSVIRRRCWDFLFEGIRQHNE